MTLFLKQSTSIDIRVGPFVDATDAVTPETGITLGAADQAEVLKANGAATAMAGTFAAVTGSDGWYDYTVATGDVDTVGEVVFVVQDSSVCLPVFTRGYVVEEAVYDAMYAAAAIGPLQGTTAGNTLDVNATGEAGLDLDNTSGTLAAAQIATGAITAAKFAADAIDAAALATDAVNEIARAIGIQKNTAKNDIEFLMIDSTDDISGKTGLTLTATRSIDAAAFGAITGSTAEVANGIYQLDASAADLNGDIITFRFTGTGANDTFLTLATVA